MTRPVLIVDIGAAGLPAVTPVVQIQASWVPAIYVAPPPPSPADLQAESISDGVLLTWSHVGGRGIEFRIERAEDVAGLPGTWLQIGSTADKRYTASTPADRVDGYWFRVRAVRNGKYSDYTGQAFQWPYASNPPVVALQIQNSTVTVDCRYQRFTLLLDQDVFYVAYTNVRQEKTVIIEVTQSGGGHILTFPTWVQSITGVPYKASSVPGATDVIGQVTSDAGINWRMTFQQPDGGGSAYSLTVTPNPAYAQVIYDGTTPVAPSIQITASQVNGVEPVTCEWLRIDSYGGTDFTIDDATAAAPVFSVPAGVADYNAVQIWRVMFTDNVSRIVQQLVTIRLQRVVALVDLTAGLLNRSFDAGDTGWDKDPNISIGTEKAYDGTYAAQLNTDFWGTAELVNQYQANVAPGTRISARCMVHQGASDAGKAGGYVRVKFYNAAGAQIGNNWDGNNVDNGSGGAWHPSTVVAVAPAGTTKARLAGVLWRTAQNKTCHLDQFTWAVLS